MGDNCVDKTGLLGALFVPNIPSGGLSAVLSHQVPDHHLHQPARVPYMIAWPGATWPRMTAPGRHWRWAMMLMMRRAGHQHAPPG